jgi:hypothetical protein
MDTTTTYLQDFTIMLTAADINFEREDVPDSEGHRQYPHTKIYVDPEKSGYGTWFYFDADGDLEEIESIY